MSEEVRWRIPKSTLFWLNEVPADRPVAMLLRHSVRGALPEQGGDYHLPLLPIGVQLATELGQRLTNRLKTLHSSPLLRCTQTATALQQGNSKHLEIQLDHHLGDPGVFVEDDQQAGIAWQTHGHERMMQFLINEAEPLAGLAEASGAAHRLMQHLLQQMENAVGIHVFVTHDSILAATVMRLLAQKIAYYQAPKYLQAAFFWCEQQELCLAYDNLCHRLKVL